MGTPLFLFMQMEFPWELGPADSRYLLRESADGAPQRVVVLDTLGAARGRRRGPLGSRRPQVEPEPEPRPVATTRVTVIDPEPVTAERQARAWLAGLDIEHEARAAAASVNRVLFAHRIATADPYVHELSPAQSLVVRAGWGEGEQVAYGNWLHARELPRSSAHRARRAAVLRPQERLAVLLGGRERELICEELALRARQDFDAGRHAHAALQLERAYTAALVELPAEQRPDLAERLAELAELHSGVAAAAHATLPTPPPAGGAYASVDASDADTSEGPTPARPAGGQPADDEVADPRAQPLDEQLLAHALGRLEAALRARTATGFAR
jgi:hypothetical protein